MKFTTLTNYRGNGPLAGQTVVESGISAQVDQQSLDMQNSDKGAQPYDFFNVMAWATKPVLRNDHLQDADGIVYTASSRVETFPDGHSEFTGMVPVGS